MKKRDKAQGWPEVEVRLQCSLGQNGWSSGTGIGHQSYTAWGPNGLAFVPQPHSGTGFADSREGMTLGEWLSAGRLS